MSEGSSYHVPAVPRCLLLPGLDTYKVPEDELPDPTPTGSHVSSSLVCRVGGGGGPSAAVAHFVHFAGFARFFMEHGSILFRSIPKTTCSFYFAPPREATPLPGNAHPQAAHLFIRRRMDPMRSHNTHASVLVIVAGWSKWYVGGVMTNALSALSLLWYNILHQRGAASSQRLIPSAPFL